MRSRHKSSTCNQSTNTAKHTIPKKNRLKSSKRWKITCIIFFCFQRNGRHSKNTVIFDESVAHYEVHAHQPYTASAFNNTDEILISIQRQDLCLLPSRSLLRVCGKLVNNNNTPVQKTKFVNNAICHLFDEIRYELNAIEIDILTKFNY